MSEVGGGIRQTQLGDALAAVKVLYRSDNEVGYGSPSFLPDGQHFLYYKVAKHSDIDGIYIGSLDEKPAQDSKRLLVADSAAVFARSPDSGVGYLLFQRNNTLLAQRFNPDLLQLQGEPDALVDQIAFVFFPSFSVSNNGALIYAGTNPRKCSRRGLTGTEESSASRVRPVSTLVCSLLRMELERSPPYLTRRHPAPISGCSNGQVSLIPSRSIRTPSHNRPFGRGRRPHQLCGRRWRRRYGHLSKGSKWNSRGNVAL